MYYLFIQEYQEGNFFLENVYDKHIPTFISALAFGMDHGCSKMGHLNFMLFAVIVGFICVLRIVHETTRK